MSQINGPARVSAFLDPAVTVTNIDLNNNNFLIHFLVESSPTCKWNTREKFLKMDCKLKDIPDWKRCPICFKGAQK